MKYFRLRYKDESFEIVKAVSHLGVVKKYDLATSKHVGTRITELTGEQLAIAISNDVSD